MTDTQPMAAASLSCKCCIVGGGPAGMMLGLLFARAGIDTIVLEKHADFLRDFRGDTIHPSTLEALNDLRLLDEFLKLPHQEVPSLEAKIGDVTIPLVDFTHLPTRAKFIAMMPQWDFLDFLAEKAKRFKSFRLLMSTEATGLLVEGGGGVAGVKARTTDGDLEIPRGSHHWRRRASLGCARRRGLHAAEHRRSHGRVLVQAFPRNRRPAGYVRESRRRTDPHSHQSWRTLAMRLHYCERLGRKGESGRHWASPRTAVNARAVSRGAQRGIEEL